MRNDLSTTTARANLAQRRAPYTAKMQTGLTLLFYHGKISARWGARRYHGCGAGLCRAGDDHLHRRRR